MVVGDLLDVEPGAPRRAATSTTVARRLRRRRRSWRPGWWHRRAAITHSPSGSTARVRSSGLAQRDATSPRRGGRGGGGRHAGAPGGGRVVDARPEHRDRDGGRHRQDHQGALLPARDRAGGHEAAQRAPVRADGSTRSPATRSAASPPGRPRPPAAPAGPGRSRRGRSGRTARRQLASSEDRERQRHQGQLGHDRPAAGRPRAAYAGELGGERVAHDQPDRDAGHRERREQHERGGRPAQPRAAGMGRSGTSHCRISSHAQAEAEADAERGGDQQDRDAARRGRAPTAGATRRRAARRARARAPGSRWRPLSSRISSARATSTSDSTAGAIELRAVDCWARTSSTDVAEVVGVVDADQVPPSTSSSVSGGIAVAEARPRRARRASGRRARRAGCRPAPSSRPGRATGLGGRDQRRRLVGLVAAVDARLLVGAGESVPGMSQSSSVLGVV